MRANVFEPFLWKSGEIAEDFIRMDERGLIFGGKRREASVHKISMGPVPQAGLKSALRGEFKQDEILQRSGNPNLGIGDVGQFSALPFEGDFRDTERAEAKFRDLIQILPKGSAHCHAVVTAKPHACVKKGAHRSSGKKPAHPNPGFQPERPSGI